MTELFCDMEKSEIRKLKTARGQIDGIIKMIEQERDCLEVSNQILATIAILKSVNTTFLTNHLSNCVNNTDQNQKMEQVINIIKKLSK
jgi:DNA-binding FrmR family transcriptional regulator